MNCNVCCCWGDKKMDASLLLPAVVVWLSNSWVNSPLSMNRASSSRQVVTLAVLRVWKGVFSRYHASDVIELTYMTSST